MALVAYLSLSLLLTVAYAVLVKKVNVLQTLFAYLLLNFFNDSIIMFFSLHKWMTVSPSPADIVIRVLHVHVLTPLVLLLALEALRRMGSRSGQFAVALLVALLLAAETFALCGLRIFRFSGSWYFGWVLLQSLLNIGLACLGSAWFASILRRDGLRP